MDIRDKIYSFIEEQGGADYDQKKELAQELSKGDTALLIQDLDRFYQGWFNVQQVKEYTDERACLEYIQETCFEVACQALALQGDPAVIPYFLKYVPTDDWDPKTEVNMEDYNSQDLEECITSVKYYGESYIPVLLTHIHELIPDKIESADSFLYQMVLDDLHYFKEEHPLFNNFYLAKQDLLGKVIEYAVEKTLKEIKEDHPEDLKLSKKILDTHLEYVSYDDKPIVKIAYLRQQFLKLHAAD